MGRWIASAVLVGVLLFAASGCANGSTVASTHGPLADGFGVAPGSRLLGAAIPHLVGNERQPFWEAIVAMEGRDRAVCTAYAKQATAAGLSVQSVDSLRRPCIDSPGFDASRRGQRFHFEVFHCPSCHPSRYAVLLDYHRLREPQRWSVRKIRSRSGSAGTFPEIAGLSGTRVLARVDTIFCRGTTWILSVTKNPAALWRRLTHVDGRVWSTVTTIEGDTVRDATETGAGDTRRITMVAGTGDDPPVLSVQLCDS